MKAIKDAALVAIWLILTSFPALAEDVAVDDFSAEEMQEEYVFPAIQPELTLRGGYRYVHLNGSGRADEYEYLHSSLILGGEFRAFSFPHRTHLELDIKNTRDYFGDVSYAFEDIIMFRGINRTLYHNLDNILLIDLDPTTNPSNPNPLLRSPAVDVRDNDHEYGMQVGISNAFFRLKTPNFPLHFYLDGMVVKKDGDQQQRSLLGAGYYNNILRTSQKRDVDTTATTITVGTNSHLGPIEIDLSHTEKRFTVNGDNVLYDKYSDAGFGGPTTQFGGVYAHNLIPELKSSANTLKLHTSYTGGLVASATFTRIDKENIDSGAMADYFIGSADVVWTASRDLTLFVKYRMKDFHADTPDEVEFADVCRPSLNSGNNYACEINQAISAKTRTASVAARYRLFPSVTLRGEFVHETVDRRDAEAWFLPDSTERNNASLSADIRLAKTLKLKLNYIHKNSSNPAYNVEPERADEGSMTVTWAPLKWLTALASYRISYEKTDSAAFVYTSQFTLEKDLRESPDDRKAVRERFLGALNILLQKNLTATVSFFYMHNKQNMDMAYYLDDFAQGFPLRFDSGVHSQDKARSIALEAIYTPSQALNLTAGMIYTESEGKFHPEDINLLAPLSIASLSELKTRETVYHIGAEYTFKSGFAAGIGYKYARFRDLLDNAHDDYNNGEAHAVSLSLSKRW